MHRQWHKLQNFATSSVLHSGKLCVRVCVIAAIHYHAPSFEDINARFKIKKIKTRLKDSFVLKLCHPVRSGSLMKSLESKPSFVSFLHNSSYDHAHETTRRPYVG